MPVPDLSGVWVLVTGGAGFIGSHLVDSLLERGARVRVLDNLATGKLVNLQRWFAEPPVHAPGGVVEAPGAPLTFQHGDIRDLQACREACHGAELVFHLAALGSVPRSMEDPATTVAVNVAGTTNVFAAAREAGVRRVIYASSSSVYGDSETLPKIEGQEGQPLSPYAWSKVANEQVAGLLGRCFGLDLVGLRYFNVYGPRQDPRGPYAAVIPRFITACLRGEPPVIFGDGQQSRDFTYVADAVAANLLAAGAGAVAGSRVFNTASGARTCVGELARLVRNATGGGLAPVYREPRAGDVRHSHASLDAAMSGLGYRPEVGLDEGLGLTAAYFRGEWSASVAKTS